VNNDEKLNDLCEFMEKQIGKLTAIHFKLKKDMRPKIILQSKDINVSAENLWYDFIDKLAKYFDWAFSSTNIEDAKNTFKSFFLENYDISEE
jgi:hypothetical protein